MPRWWMRPQAWGKVTLGVLVIGATLVTLWAIWRPALPGTREDEREPDPRAA